LALPKPPRHFTAPSKIFDATTASKTARRTADGASRLQRSSTWRGPAPSPSGAHRCGGPGQAWPPPSHSGSHPADSVLRVIRVPADSDGLRRTDQAGRVRPGSASESPPRPRLGPGGGPERARVNRPRADATVDDATRGGRGRRISESGERRDGALDGGPTRSAKTRRAGRGPQLSSSCGPRKTAAGRAAALAALRPLQEGSGDPAGSCLPVASGRGDCCSKSRERPRLRLRLRLRLRRSSCHWCRYPPPPPPPAAADSKELPQVGPQLPPRCLPAAAGGRRELPRLAEGRAAARAAAGRWRRRQRPRGGRSPCAWT
jgi:hypothetical protein